MRNILRELTKLIVMTIIVMVAFFGAMGFVALMVKGIEILPQYIGGFGTFMLYLAVYALIISLIIKSKK